MAEADAPAPDAGALSVDAAAAYLRSSREPESEPKAGAASAADAAPDVEEDEGIAPEGGEPAASDEDEVPLGDEDDPDDESGQDKGGDAAALEPPQFWKPEWKEQFASFPKEVQEIILAQEKERDTVLSTATTRANTARAALETEARQLAERRTEIDALLPRARETFKGRWEGVDWDAVLDQHGAEETLKLQNQARRELTELQALEQAQREADDAELNNYIARERENLKAEAPELVDPKEGQARRQSVAKFLGEQGFSGEQMKRASAKQIAIAYDAMRFRQLKSSTVAQNPRSAAPPARPTARPSAAPARSPQRQVQTARDRLTQSGSVDDAIAYLRTTRER